MYKVIHQFLDLQDGNYHYKVGDTYPREGKKAVAARVKELSGTGNKIKKPLIEKIEAKRTTTRKQK